MARAAQAGETLNADVLRRALRDAAGVAHHPRVRRLQWQDRDLVAVAPRPGPQGRDRLQVEARVLRATTALRTPSGQPIAAALKLVTSDMLVVDSVGTESLHDWLLAEERDRTRPPDWAAVCGELLATLHGAPCPVEQPARQEVPLTYPLTPAVWADLPDTVLAVLTDVGHHEQIRAAANRSRAHSESGSIWVHGDFKPDNLLLTSPDDSAPGLRAVDWEMSGRGAAADDLGALFAGLTLAEVARVARISMPGTVSQDLRAGLDRAVSMLQRTLAVYRRHRVLDCSELPADALADAMVLRLVARSQGLARVSPGPTAMLSLVVRLASRLLARLDVLTTNLADHLKLAVRS